MDPGEVSRQPPRIAADSTLDRAVAELKLCPPLSASRRCNHGRGESFRGCRFGCACARQFVFELGIQARKEIARHLCRWQIESQLAVAQTDNPWKALRNIDLMQSDYQSCAVISRSLCQCVDRQFGPSRIEGRERLIDQPQRSRREHGACQPHPLPFAAGKPVDAIPKLIGEVEPFQRSVGLGNTAGVNEGTKALP